MTDSPIKWTDQQTRAVQARGRDVLVTASAGTGKTAVLSGRAVHLLADPDVCTDVLGMLVLTFTDAAAQQMRQRIGELLKAAYRHAPGPRLARQIVLLPGADISTIHAFCKRLITEHFSQLGLDPTFSVIDGDEAFLLKTEVLERTVEWAWRQPNLIEGLGELLRGRDLRTGEGFLRQVIDIADSLAGIVDRDRWFHESGRLLSVSDYLGSDLADEQRRTVIAVLEGARDRLTHARRIIADCDSGSDPARQFEQIFVKHVREALVVAEQGDWAQLAQQDWRQPKPPFARLKDLPEPVCSVVADLTKEAWNDLRGLADLLVMNPEYLARIELPASRQSRLLLQLVRQFGLLYGQTKQSLNCLDFADLERFALKLLVEPDHQTSTATAAQVRDRYHLVFVDEYQDINPVQQTILDALCRGDNCFGVGDVKQSIYGWRGAEPTIFLDRLNEAFTDPDGKDAPLRVDLNTNFRSNKPILDFVNAVFSRIMTASFTGHDYDDAAALRPDPNAPVADAPGSGPFVGLHILDDEAVPELPDAPATDVTARRLQAAMIARQIHQMVGVEADRSPLRIYDKARDALRDVRYGDIVILMRSVKGVANDYVEILRLAGIPVSCRATAGYFEATEVRDVLSLLKVLDNPQRDIELAAVLRSPLFSLVDDDLAEIHLHGRNRKDVIGFHAAVLRYAENGPNDGLRTRINEILGRLGAWRTLAARGDLADLIWLIYQQTHILSFVSALPSGQARRANLLKLHDRAIQFSGFVSSAAQPSLARFVSFVEELEDEGQDWAPAEPDSPTGNAVRILSIHKSKGLEFPVVFLAELQSRFKLRDGQSDVLTDSQGGVGLRVIDPDARGKLASLAHQVFAERKRPAALAEEMRILYVAMTRAQQRLVLTASGDGSTVRRILTEGRCLSAGAIPKWRLSSSHSGLEWILLALSNEDSLRRILDQAARSCVKGPLLTAQLLGLDEVSELADFVTRLRSSKAVPTKAVTDARADAGRSSQSPEEIRQVLDWTYPFGSLSVLPAKSTVTEITHAGDEFARRDYSRALDREPAVLTQSAGLSTRPSRRLIGTATHLLMASLDLAAPVTIDGVEQVKHDLVAAGALSAGVAEQIDPAPIVSFFAGPLGQRVLASADAVRREWPFTFAFPVDEYCRLTGQTAPGGDETIVVQGIVDLLVRTDAGLLVIDFKTDRITPEAIDHRADSYRTQLKLYGRAVRAILDADSVETWLYFLAAGSAVKVE